MNAQTVEGKALSYVLVTPEGVEPDAGYPLVILLHGFGASMYDLVGLASPIDQNGYVYAFPNAPYRINFGGGAVGYSWALGREGVEPPPPGTPSADELLESFIAEVMAQTKAQPGRVVLGGFSQGGGTTLRYGLPRSEQFAGLIVLSGAFRDPDEVRRTLPEKRSQPIFIAHGRHDPLISQERGQETKRFLEEAGYTPVFNEYDMAHEISPGVIRDLIPWLHETLPPSTVAK